MKNLTKHILILLILTFALPLDGHAKKRTKAERKAIDSTVMWEHKFPGAVVRLEMTPSGKLHAVARDGKGKKSPQTRYLLSYLGKVLWRGPALETALLSDNPYNIMMSVDQRGLVFSAVDNTGKTKWTHINDGIPASTISDDISKVLIMVVMPYEWGANPSKEYPATLQALNMNTGKINWTTSLGNIKGKLTEFGGELAIHNGSVWWAAGGRAFKASLSNGSLAFNVDINANSSAHTSWAFQGVNAAALKGGSVSYFDQGGLKWQQSIKGADKPVGLAITGAGVAASVAGKKSLVLTMLDLNSGSSRWQKTAKHNLKKMGLPPSGLAVLGNVVAIAANRRVIGYDVSSGSEIYSVKMKKKHFLMTDDIRSFGSHFVLVGFEGATAFNISNGSVMWEKHGFVDPVAEIRAQKQAVWSIAIGNLKSGVSPQARAAWKKHSEGSMSYTAAAQTAAFYNRIHNQKEAEKTKKAAKNLSKLGEIDLLTVNRSLGPNFAEFYESRGGSFLAMKNVQHLDGVVMDLRSGSTRSAGTRKARAGCVGQILVDPHRGRMVQVFRQMGFGCRDEMKIEMYGF